MKLQNESSSVGAEYAAPPGLKFILVGDATKMPRRWRWEGATGFGTADADKPVTDRRSTKSLRKVRTNHQPSTIN